MSFLQQPVVAEVERQQIDQAIDRSRAIPVEQPHGADFAFLRGEATFGVLGVSDGRLGVSLTAGVRL